MCSNYHKQPTLVEMLNTIMHKKEMQAGISEITQIPANTATPSPAKRKRAVSNFKQDCNKRMPLCAIKKPRGQISIKNMLSHVTSDIPSENEICIDEYAEFIRPLQRSTHTSTQETTEANNACISLSDSSDSAILHANASKPSSPKLVSSQPIIISDITICGPTKTSPPSPRDPSSLKHPVKTSSEYLTVPDSRLIGADAAPQARKDNPRTILLPVNDFSTVNNILNKEIGDSYVAKTVANGYLIRCNDVTSYNKLSQFLENNQENINTNTLQAISLKPIKFIVSHLNKSTPPKWIWLQLTKLGYNVTHVKVIKSRSNGNPLNLFSIELANTDESSVETILELKTLGNHKVSIKKWKSIASRRISTLAHANIPYTHSTTALPDSCFQNPTLQNNMQNNYLPLTSQSKFKHQTNNSADRTDTNLTSRKKHIRFANNAIAANINSNKSFNNFLTHQRETTPIIESIKKLSNTIQFLAEITANCI